MLTKIDVARAHIISAVDLFFRGAELAPILLLAGSAREILTIIGDKTGVETVLHRYASEHGLTIKAAAIAIHQKVRFLKHADTDPQDEIELTTDDVTVALWCACHDLGKISKGMPVEAQVYETWYWATTIKVTKLPLSLQERAKQAIRFFPNIRSASLEKQKSMGLEALDLVRNDPDLQMEYNRYVRLPI